MPYVERDSGTNAIKGVYPNPQPGYAEEWLDDGNAEIVAYLNPPPTQEQVKIAALKANARRRALVTAIQSSDDAGLIAAVQARYPSLTGDALKAVTDLALLAAAAIRQ